MITLLSGGLLAACGSNEDVQRTEAPSLVDLCTEYSPENLPHGAEILGTEIREAVNGLPETCVVRGQIVSSPESTITWAVELVDPRLWNGKTITLGGGGFDGFIPTDRTGYLRRYGSSAANYVKMSSDSGHQVRSFYPWAMDDTALRNHGYIANHLTLEVGTSIATSFYDEAPARRYMIGHSNGGRSGLVAAQRYPGDYDGIIALAPAISQQAHEINVRQTLEHLFADPENWMSPDDIALYAGAEIAACDGLDGLEDGIIGNVNACDYDGSDLLCGEAETEGCLRPGQLESVRLIYSSVEGPFRLQDGLSAGYPRFGRGGAATGNWTGFLFGESFENPSSFNYRVGADAAKVVEQDNQAGLWNHQPSRYEPGWQRISGQLDPTNHDLSAFAAGDGKLLIAYPVADACVSVYRTAEYYDSVREQMGGSAARAFSRFFAMPGLGHGMVGPGANSVDFVAALDAWVEQGIAPDGLVAAKYEQGNSEPAFRRPVCQYPAFPRYDGKGDPTRADSFYCASQ